MTESTRNNSVSKAATDDEIVSIIKHWFQNSQDLEGGRAQRKNKNVHLTTVNLNFPPLDVNKYEWTVTHVVSINYFGECIENGQIYTNFYILIVIGATPLILKVY